MVITAVVMVIEVIGGYLTGSLALSSDAGHMFTHLFALAISFTAIVIACKEPCHHRTYGFYRVEILAALFNSIFLFGVTAYIFYQGIMRLLNPQPVLGF
jgi:cobalt-zinc-cadmium efflux system protein